MLTYSLFVEDTRYTVPTLLLVTVGDETGLRDLARKTLNDSEYHLAVAAWAEDAFLFSLSRDELVAEALCHNA